MGLSRRRMLRRGFGFAYERIQSIYFGHIENPRDVVPSVTIKSARKSIRDDKKFPAGFEVMKFRALSNAFFSVSLRIMPGLEICGKCRREGDSPCRALHLNSYLRRDFKVMCLGVSRSGHQLEPVMGVDEVLQGHNENPSESRGPALKRRDRVRVGISNTGHFDGFFPQRTVETSSLRQLVQAHAGYKLC